MSLTSGASVGEIGEEVTVSWRRIDDGSGKRSLYISSTGEKTRERPQEYQDEDIEYLCNGDPKYYYIRKGKGVIGDGTGWDKTGPCSRCRAPFVPFVLHHGDYDEVYSLNLCQNCVYKQVGESIGKTLMGNGTKIWEVMSKEPKIGLHPLRECTFDEKRELKIYSRLLEAKLYVMKGKKHRRNKQRMHACEKLALQYEGMDVLLPLNYDVTRRKGNYISWGYDKFDEYFGEIKGDQGDDYKLSTAIPHGLGVKFYSDESTYCGEWNNGVPFTDKKGILLRPDGSSYEGNWVNGKRHGMGEQRYPDGAAYKGQFANGFEHGQGSMTYPDRSYFEGRFRFGRRDGPGVLAPASGPTERGNFKDKHVYYNFEMPVDSSEGKSEEMILRDLRNDQFDDHQFKPISLMNAAGDALGNYIRDPISRKKYLNGAAVKVKIPGYVREGVVKNYLEKYHHDNSESVFRREAGAFAFIDKEHVNINSGKLTEAATEFFLYIIGANAKLKTLQFTCNKLNAPTFALLTAQIQRQIWPTLTTLDLSYNPVGKGRIAETTLHHIAACCLGCPSITTLKLAGCRISSDLVPVVAEFITLSKHLIHLDLAFNLLEQEGAEYISEALENNQTLKILNLRQNGLMEMGGLALVNCLKYNLTLEQLIIADNMIGLENMKILSGRLGGTMGDVCKSVKPKELVTPFRYVYGRYERLDLKKLMEDRVEVEKRRKKGFLDKFKSSGFLALVAGGVDVREAGGLNFLRREVQEEIAEEREKKMLEENEQNVHKSLQAFVGDIETKLADEDYQRALRVNDELGLLKRMDMAD